MSSAKLFQSNGSRANTEMRHPGGFATRAAFETGHKHSDEQEVPACSVVRALAHEAVGFHPLWKRSFARGHELLKCFLVELLLFFDVANFLQCGDPAVAFFGPRVYLRAFRGGLLKKRLRVREDRHGIDSLTGQRAADWLAAGVWIAALLEAFRKLV